MNLLRSFHRQALHARRLSLIHPETGTSMEWTVDLPADMVALLDALRLDTQEQS